MNLILGVWQIRAISFACSTSLSNEMSGQFDKFGVERIE